MTQAIRLVLRFAVIGLVAFGMMRLADYAMALNTSLSTTDASAMALSLLIGLLIVYMVLMAVPFVPGVEIGVALLILRGAEFAPIVYLATLAGLIAAFLIGRLTPQKILTGFLYDLRLRRAAAMVERFSNLPEDQRLTRLKASLPKPLAIVFVRARYLTLAGALNMPGNSLVGGGGGLMMLAGLSGVFRPAPTLVMLSLAVLPVPLLVWFWGPGILSS